jgi:signal transduction histidine kinase
MDNFDGDSNNLMEALQDREVGIIFIDCDFYVRPISFLASDLFEVGPAEQPWPLKEIVKHINHASLVEDLREVWADEHKLKQVVTTPNRRWYILGLYPYFSGDGHIEGATLTFTEFTDLRGHINSELGGALSQSDRQQKQILRDNIIDRWNLGGYLHDHLGQELAALKITLTMIREDLSENGSSNEITNRLNQAIGLVDKGITNVRNFSHDIAPADIGTEKVAQTYRRLIRRLQTMHEVNCQLHTGEIINKITNRELATNGYYIIQEAVKNAVLRGEAENITIRIDTYQQQLRLQITDDGKGLSATSTPPSGKGIAIMRHRIQQVGGSFAIGTNGGPSGKPGTRITCLAPLENISKQQ